jgi:sarcosine oxidase/L-pipecolate oxidase
MTISQACVYARFLCVQAGVNFVLGEPQGKLETLIIEKRGVQKKVTGIQTCDGRSHFGDLVIVACEEMFKISVIVYTVLTYPYSW